MKIEKKDERTTEFCDLDRGECFQYEDSYYIKMDDNEYFNATNLESGSVCTFRKYAAVKRVNAKVVVE